MIYDMPVGSAYGLILLLKCTITSLPLIQEAYQVLIENFLIMAYLYCFPKL